MKKYLIGLMSLLMFSLCFAQNVPLRIIDPLPIGLRSFSSAPLPNGDIMVMGGTSNNISASSTCYRFNYQTETWSNLSDLAFAAADMQVAILDDGRILAVGGTNDFISPIQTSQLYDPTSDTWIASGSNFESLLDGYTRFSLVVLPDNYVLLSTSQGEIAIYDVNADTWTQIDPGPIDAGGSPAYWLTEQQEIIFTGAGGQIYIPNAIPTTGSLFYLDPAQPLIPDINVMLEDGRVLMINTELNFNNEISIYEPTTRTASIVGEMPFNAGIQTRNIVRMADGKVLSFGFGDPTAPNDTKIIQVYEPETNEWLVGTYADLGPFSTPHLHLLPNAGILAISGGPEPSDTNPCWILNNEGPNSIQTNLQTTIKLYPNPVQEVLFIEHASSEMLDGECQFILRNLQGQTVFQTTLTSNQVNLPRSNLAAGTYYVQLIQHEKPLIHLPITLK